MTSAEIEAIVADARPRVRVGQLAREESRAAAERANEARAASRRMHERVRAMCEALVQARAERPGAT